MLYTKLEYDEQKLCVQFVMCGVRPNKSKVCRRFRKKKNLFINIILSKIQTWESAMFVYIQSTP